MHNNNFDFLRILFACFVMITHCYVSTGMGKSDWLGWRTEGQLIFSQIGLCGFFSISGFLVFQSLMRSINLFDYIKKRILRIFPGLIAVLVVIFFICALIYQDGIGNYFLSTSPYTYILSQLSLFESYQNNISGIFENNVLWVVNGPLWTIAYEFFLYLLIAPLMYLPTKTVKNILLIGFIICALGFYYINHKKYTELFIPFTSLQVLSIFYFGAYFIAGSLLASFNLDHEKRKNLIVVSTLVVFIISIELNVFFWVKFILFPLIIIPFGLMNTRYISGFSRKIGDLSYGIYIYGFFIQQLLLHFFNLNYWQLGLIAIPLAAVCGFFSWNLIEKRALKFKSKNIFTPQISN